MRLTQHQRSLLERATRDRIDAASAYKRAWLKDPTARGYAAVDRALDRLELAEDIERRASAGELPPDFYADKAA